jgi:hypothetical protein
MRMRICSCVILFYASIAASLRASVAEPFNYPPGTNNIVGLNGGSGFSSAYSAGGGTAGSITATSLSFGSLDTSGNKLTTTPGANLIVRNFDAADTFTDGTTFYISFLMRWDGTQTSSWGGLQLMGNGPAQLFIGHPGSNIANYSIERAAADSTAQQSTVPAMNGQTALLVARVQLASGNDVVRLYVNPTPDGPEPATGSAPDLTGQNFGTISQLGFSTSDAYSFDEVRVGLTYASVVPAPEPGGLALLTIASAALATRRRH